MQLNEQQNDIVNHIVNKTGSLIVLARAGCGKTYVLVNGIVKAIADNKLGNGVLMAFNKAAATEFETRIDALAKETGNARLYEIETGTVHSIGLRFWRKHVGGRIQVEGWKVHNLIRDTHGKNYEFTSHVAKLVSLAKQQVFRPDTPNVEWLNLIEHHDIDANGNAEEIIEVSKEILAANNREKSVIDFDDMIYLPVVFDIRVDTFSFVLIDEAQDTNAARRLLAFKMLKPNGRLVAVGDDKQAIYGFTGADSDSLDIIRDALNADVLPLTITYRCPANVVAEANKLVPDLIAHPTAPLGNVRTIPAFVEMEPK